MKLTTRQLRKVIREEVRKTRLNEAAAKVTLPKGFRLSWFENYDYALECYVYDMEPLSGLTKNAAQLPALFKKYSKDLGVKKVKNTEPLVSFDNGGDVYAYIRFTSSMHDDDMDAVLGGQLGQH